eukprot:1149906-Pelagomonas_calceolata.AAC.6
MQQKRLIAMMNVDERLLSVTDVMVSVMRGDVRIPAMVDAKMPARMLAMIPAMRAALNDARMPAMVEAN